ncbi:hypothetical protein LTR36_002824 [Oleoguttula mirabilis]|uniref:Uncharacterized protein n=1 Tax=Oleoguttula mirabilis TaxID=1507867 RepID=A0AAV9JJ90_9PEZI|nr:hypothetical protein LTR36_002824 [Oleoguttula mirabilis]
MAGCSADNDYDGRIGVRISAIFVILLGSFLGSWFPVFAARHPQVGIPSCAFFIAKYFGSGVIVATAFIHLLAPANDALTNPCLTGPITGYAWVEGIVLMVIFSMFVLELMTMRYAKFGHDHGHNHDIELGSHAHAGSERCLEPKEAFTDSEDSLEPKEAFRDLAVPGAAEERASCSGPHVPGDDHLSHSRSHVDRDAEARQHDNQRTFDPESYTAQLTAVFILEFGVIFHSVFIGLTLAVSGGKEFITLYVVLAFHQTFEGLALGTRLASVEWPKSKRWTPYLLAMGYAISTPIAIAIGLGLRTTFAPGSQRTLIVNGVFDSISAGILIYTGLIELMAHEFMFSDYMQKAPIREVLAALGMMAMGAGLMALLGKWA